ELSGWAFRGRGESGHVTSLTLPKGFPLESRANFVPTPTLLVVLRQHPRSSYSQVKSNLNELAGAWDCKSVRGNHWQLVMRHLALFQSFYRLASDLTQRRDFKHRRTNQVEKYPDAWGLASKDLFGGWLSIGAKTP